MSETVREKINFILRKTYVVADGKNVRSFTTKDKIDALLALVESVRREAEAETLQTIVNYMYEDIASAFEYAEKRLAYLSQQESSSEKGDHD